MYLDIIKNKLNEAFLKCGITHNATVSFSNKPDMCDYQCNDCFKLAKELSENPISLGEKIVSIINEDEKFNDVFSKVEFCKPGFINMTLSDKFINSYLISFDKSIKNSVKLENGETIVLDYGGPNVAKPLHVGHMRTAIVGESIKRILQFFGNKVISDVHLGDIGLQIGQVIYKVLEEEKKVEDINIEYLNLVYPKMSKLCKEDDDIKEKCATITKELQEGNKLYKTIWKKICEVSVADIKKNYDYLDVKFDYWYGESDAYEYLDETTNILSNILESSMGAKIINVSEVSDKLELPPLLYQKSNGAYLYASSDLATILQRKKDFNPSKILYVTDLRQALHFTQVFRAADKAKLFSLNNLEHLGYGTVNGEDNKPYKTRSGETPRLEDLFIEAKNIFVSKKDENANLGEENLNIIVNSILKFSDLQNSREKDYIFDLSKFSEVVGKTGPYILYTYLRINKILNDYENEYKLTNITYNEFDRNLRNKLLEVGKYLELSYIERKPNYICEYLYSLCSTANIFYQNNYLNTITDKEKLENYLFILNLTNKYIIELLELLAIKIPSKM